MKYSDFADKFNPDCGILQLMNDLSYAVNQDKDICMLGGGNPAAIPEMEACFRSELKQLMDQGNEFEEMIGNYDAPQGNHRFIRALAGLLQDTFDWPVTEKNIAVTNGSQASFGIVFNLLSGRYGSGLSKHIRLPLAPEYIGYADVGLGENELFQSSQPIIRMDEDDGLFFKYRVDFENLEIGETCAAICLSRPTNPTGNVVTDTELAKLSMLARQRDIPLIVDGAYGLPFPGILFVDANPVWEDHVILCLSLSKLGLPGARTGIIVANEDLIALISRSNAIFNLAPGRFGPSLLTRLVQSRELIPVCRSVVQPYYEERVNHAVRMVRERMAGIPVRIHKPEGAMFLWLWFEGIPVSSEILYQRLKQRGVFVIAGHHFFPGLQESWQHKHECIRVSYAGDPLKVEQGLQVIAEEVRRAYDPVPRTVTTAGA
ncbi:MAG: valine--pyruvate transaminase [Gammaproteobacteria bacterium]|nr:valine--pyruvate transaminase [Gammaproteobacteria bacterium]